MLCGLYDLIHPLWRTGAHTELRYSLTFHISREGISVTYPSIELVQALGRNRRARLTSVALGVSHNPFIRCHV